jgi:hypothetical protein
MCLTLLLVTHMVFCRGMYLFLQCSWTGLLKKVSISASWTFWFVVSIHSRTNSILTGRQCAGGSSFWQRSFSFMRYMSFFPLVELVYLEQNEPFSTLKSVIYTKYSY